VLLSRGDFTRGFAEYEWRKRRVSATDKRDFAQPLWLGEANIAGKTVLLHAEQGYDDTIQFVRYAPLVAAPPSCWSCRQASSHCCPDGPACRPLSPRRAAAAVRSALPADEPAAGVQNDVGRGAGGHSLC
jgi:hypothetical protein